MSDEKSPLRLPLLAALEDLGAFTALISIVLLGALNAARVGSCNAASRSSPGPSAPNGLAASSTSASETSKTTGGAGSALRTSLRTSSRACVKHGEGEGQCHSSRYSIGDERPRRRPDKG